MTDTTIPAVAINALNTTITGVGVVVFGVQTGLDYPTLLAGVFGGALALSYSERDGLLFKALEVISASLLAGYLTPVLAAILLHKLVKWDLISPEANIGPQLNVGLAVTIAYTAHGILLPGLRKIYGKLLRRAANV